MKASPVGCGEVRRLSDDETELVVDVSELVGADEDLGLTVPALSTGALPR